MTGRAFVLLLIAASTLFAARNVGIGWLYALGYSLAAGVLASALLGAWALQGIRITPVPGRKTEAGVPLPVAITVENRGRWTRRYLCVLAGPLGIGAKLWPWRRFLLPDGWGSVLIPELKPGERLTFQLPIPAPRRGIHPLPAVYVQAAPLGLVACFRRIRSEGQTAAEAMVHPRIHPLDGLPWLGSRRGHGEETASTRPKDGGELLKTVRPYRTGDPMRQIHWKTTARTGQLVVRETEGEDNPQGLAVVLDLSSEHSPETLDHAVEITASLLVQAQRMGMEARLLSQVGKPAHQTLNGQLDWLATVSLGAGGPIEPTLAQASGSQVVLVSPRQRGGRGLADVTITVPPEKNPWPSTSAQEIVCPPGSDIARTLRGQA